MINSTPRAVKFAQHRARLVSVCLGFGVFVVIYTERQKNRVFALTACSLSSRLGGVGSDRADPVLDRFGDELGAIAPSERVW